MKLLLAPHRIALLLSMLLVNAIHANSATWISTTGNWTNSANWADGIIPGYGDSVTFAGASGVHPVRIPDDHPFTLSSISMNPSGIPAAWELRGGTNTMIAPAAIEISHENLFFDFCLDGSDGLQVLCKTENSLALAKTNILIGTINISGGRLLPRFDLSLGTPPATLLSDAIVLNNSTLGNYTWPGVDIHPNRGIQINGHVALHGRNLADNGFLRINSPISGSGDIAILHQTSYVEFTNPNNSYTGDTYLGGRHYGWYDGTGTAHLILGADEVIPDTSRLIFVNGHAGRISLNNHLETVAGIVTASSTFSIDGSGGRLRTPADIIEPLNGVINAGATLEITDGTTRFAHAAALAGTSDPGTLAINAGALIISSPLQLGNLTVALDGGNLALETMRPGLAEYRSRATFNTNATDFVFNGVYIEPRWANSSTTEFGHNTQYRYDGEWYIPADAYYSFAKAFDDGATLIIDGQTIIHNNVHNQIVVVKDIYLTQGWHTLSLYFSNGTGGVGPREVDGFTSGLLYDPANSDILDANGKLANGTPFADPGDGSVLRTFIPNTPASATLELSDNATLECIAAPQTPLVWSAGITSKNGANLHVANSQHPFAIGGTGKPILLSANITSDSGIRLQDRVWLKQMPDNPILAQGLDVAVGVAELLGTGATTLNQYSLRIPIPDALGDPLAAPITVNAGYTLTLDATREYDDQLYDDPEYTLAISNTITLAGGTLAFDGAGVVTLTTPVTGSGNLTKVGTGTAILSASNTFTGQITLHEGQLGVTDESQLGDINNTIIITGGELIFLEDTTLNTGLNIEGTLTVPAGRTVTINGALEGTLNKQGTGSLILGKANQYLDLHVTEGSVILASTTGPAIRHLLGVDTGAELILDGTKQIEGDVTLTGGTMDLNGNNYEFNIFTCSAPSTITNSTSVVATITIDNDNSYGFAWGSIAPDINILKKGSAAFSLYGTAADTQSTAFQIDKGRLALGQEVKYVRLTLLKTRTPGNKPRLGELVLTLNGCPVPYPAGVATYATSSQQPHVSQNSIDGTTSSFWMTNESEAPSVTVDLKQPLTFNGYAIYSGTNIANMAAHYNDPVSWSLEVSQDNINWLLADSVADAQLYSNQPGVKIYERSLGESGNWPALTSFDETEVTVATGSTLSGAAPLLNLGTLSGSGNLDLMRGTTTSVSDLSNFNGMISGAGSLLISGTVALDIPNEALAPPYQGRLASGNRLFMPADPPTVGNANTPASVVTGSNNQDTSFAASLQQASAPLSLVKTGSGRVILSDAGSSYTGDTTIEDGILTVKGRSNFFRYIKFDVTAVKNTSPDAHGYNMAYAEFQLLKDGVPVAWPSGTTATAPSATPTHNDNNPMRAIDGNLLNRFLTGPLQAITIDTQTGVQFDAYRVYESPVNDADNGRCPRSWSVEGSDDGINWISLDLQTLVPTPAFVQNQVTLIDTFSLSPSLRAWLPDEFKAATPADSLNISALTTSQLCFQVLAPREERNTWDSSGSGYSLSALTLLKEGEVVPWPEGTTASTPAPGWNTPIGNPENLVNNNENASSENRFYSSSTLNHIFITTPSPVTFDAYRWVTSYNVTGRDPVSWRLMVSPANNESYHYLVDEQLNYQPPTARGAIAGPFPIIQPAGLDATDSIPDTSRVVINPEATLELGAGAFETIGPLLGQGNLLLGHDATLGINLFEDATFNGTLSGSFSGNTTLRLLGTHTQYFDTTTSVPGNLAVDFQGGSFGGTLHVNGELVVTGSVSYPLPAILPFRTVLFTFGSISTTSRDNLIAGEASIETPAGMHAKVIVSDSTATLTISAPGTLIMLR